MLVHNSILLIVLIFSLINYNLNKNFNRFLLIVFFIFLALFIGLRHSGTDLTMYIKYFNTIKEQDSYKITSQGDIAFEYMIYLFSRLDLYFFFPYIKQVLTDNPFARFEFLTTPSFYLVTISSAVLFLIGIFKFIIRFSNPWLALFILMPHYIFIISMSAMRQSIALGIFFLAILYLCENKRITFYLLILLGALFHKPIIILSLIGIFSEEKIKIKHIIAMTILILGMYLLKAEEFNRLFWHYLGPGQTAQQLSLGFWIRIVPYIFTLFLFFYLNNKISINKKEKNVYFALAIFIILIFIMGTIATTTEDRFLIYMAPFQVFVLYKFINFTDKIRTINFVNLFIVYSLLLINYFAYFNFSFYADSWIPYKHAIVF